MGKTTWRLIPARAGNTCRIFSPLNSKGAHPRSRGEHSSGMGLGGVWVGSSPLARGTHSSDQKRRQRPGLIPARAGNTATPKNTVSGSRAHPRSRGEHRAEWHLVICLVGSSPLARGTLGLEVCHSLEVGLIPARAGNTWGLDGDGKKAGAHPRSRGEHARRARSVAACAGSSPLARGTPGGREGLGGVVGLIPARAGNTWGLDGDGKKAGAHPRSRGEHARRARSVAACAGSSPLARGTPGGREGLGGVVGLIPARAGNTNREDVVVVVHGAHPRSRGEHKLPRLVLSPLVGSSPLARGTLYSFQGVLNCGGLIPARAGNTAVRTCRVWLSRAHPRSRGEHPVD